MKRTPRKPARSALGDRAAFARVSLGAGVDRSGELVLGHVIVVRTMRIERRGKGYGPRYFAGSALPGLPASGPQSAREPLDVVIQILGAKRNILREFVVGRFDPIEVESSGQRRAFAVDTAALPNTGHVSHVSPSDRAFEWLQPTDLPAFSAPCHPDSAAGLQESPRLFERRRHAILGK